MGKIRCTKCGMVASVPDNINAGGNYLSDSAICPSSGMVIRCGGCGNILVGPPQAPTTSVGSGTGSVKPPISTLNTNAAPTASGCSTSGAASLPQGSAKCPKCGYIFKVESSSHPAAPITTPYITCPSCRRPARKPKISRSVLDSPCGTIKISCDMCRTVIFEGTPKDAYAAGYVEVSS